MAAWLIAEWSTAGLLRAHPPVHGALHQRGAPCGACEWVTGCRAARSAGRGSRITGPVVSVRYEQARRAAAPSGGRDAGGAGRTSCVAVVRYARADRCEGAGRSSGALAVVLFCAPCWLPLAIRAVTRGRLGVGWERQHWLGCGSRRRACRTRLVTLPVFGLCRRPTRMSSRARRGGGRRADGFRRSRRRRRALRSPGPSRGAPTASRTRGTAAG